MTDEEKLAIAVEALEYIQGPEGTHGGYPQYNCKECNSQELAWEALTKINNKE